MQSTVHEVKLVSVREGISDISFEGYDTCIHTAALVHKKESHYQESDYFHVNTDLTVELAQQAKLQGVKQFIFFSTMAVYGIEKGMISSGSSLQPKTMYGKSKLAAEQVLEKMGEHQFIFIQQKIPTSIGRG